MPKDGHLFEVIKRISIVAVAIFAYPVLGLIALIGYPYTKEIEATPIHPSNKAGGTAETQTKQPSIPAKGLIDNTYFVRFLGIFDARPSKFNIVQALNTDQDDYESGYNKGCCLYTKHCIQPLVIDARASFVPEISVAYPFAVLVDKDVELAYWSLQDMDRNLNRDLHMQKKQEGIDKYNPQDESAYHTLYAEWKSVHFTSVRHFEEKIKALHPDQQVKGCYLSRSGKKKPAQELMGRHNEAAIRYQPKENVRGLLVKNTPEAIALAKEVKQHFKDVYGKKVFIAYQSADDGKLYRIN